MSENLESLDRLVGEFKKLPGIGSRTAERLAYHLLRIPKGEALALARAIADVKKNMRHCSECFNLTEEELCAVCRDPRRERSLICVVEQPRDVWALERTGSYRGLYHVLLGRLAPHDDMRPEDLNLDELATRAEKSEVKEVVIATNPNLEGEGTAAFVKERLSGLDV